LTITRGANNYYGGVLCAPGLVRDCVITNNAAISWGGGIFVGNGGRVMNSIITGNRGLGSQSIGGGVFISRDGFARNCLITGNSANDGGGVCTWFGGTLENCTVSANNAPHYGGGAYVRYGGSVNNNIFYYNTSPYNNPDCYVSGSGWKCNYNQAGNAIPGYGNSTAPPGFVDQATGDYHLAAGSACIDTGSNITWMTSSFDIDGQMRVIYSTVDRGAYEYADRLWCGIRAKPLEVLVNGPVQFESLLAGTNKTSVYYWWDFDDNGSIDSQGLDKHAPVWHYSVTGTYSSVLTVSNDIGQVATSLAERYITVLPGVQADFSASPLTGVVPHIVYFTSLARNNPQYWYWDFDNDQIVDSISSNPVHIFMIEGTYTVVMTVSNNFGNGGWSMATMTKTNYIEVLPEPLTVLMLVFMAGLAGRRAHYW